MKNFVVVIVLICSAFANPAHSQRTVDEVLQKFAQTFPIQLQPLKNDPTVKIMEETYDPYDAAISTVKLEALDFMRYKIQVLPFYVKFFHEKGSNIVYCRDNIFRGTRGSIDIGIPVRIQDYTKNYVWTLHNLLWFPLTKSQKPEELKFPAKADSSTLEGLIGEPQITGYSTAGVINSYLISINSVNEKTEIIDLHEEELWFVEKYKYTLQYVGEGKRTEPPPIEVIPAENVILIALSSAIIGKRYYFLWYY